ncbi:hypothetical protein EZS27_041819, partial [termite gut metagenome]
RGLRKQVKLTDRGSLFDTAFAFFLGSDL